MNVICRLALTAAIVAMMGAAPAVADPGRGHGKDRYGRHDHQRQKPPARYIADCPPGLAKKNPPCIPPGQARNHDTRHGNRVGDILRLGDYVIIRNPGRYNLTPHRDWRYYRDDSRIYRIDSGSRKVLAVLNLIDALSD